MSFALATYKEGPLKLDSRHSLSLKLLRVVLLAALAVGAVLSCAQIVFDAYKARQAVNSDAQRILAMVRDPSTQAVYSLDREMAMQVLEGLFQHEAVRQASIGHPGEPMLAEKSRPLLDLPTRWLTDPILGQERTFSIRLIGRPPYSEYYGDLKITLDTAPYGENFVTTSEIIFISGILRALAMGLVLFLVYHWMLTKPLSKIIEHLVSINPDRPGQHQLPLLKGHERNELGLWVTTANQLLASIESNSHLRREAEDNLLRISQYDFLTGLPNRQLLQQQLDQILDGAGRQQRRVAVLCLGLDDFKGINEQYTYQLGDQLLIALADRLRGHSARLGSLARLGGDQFALVQADIEQPYEAAELAQSILDGLEAPFEIDQHEVRLRATIGITLFPEDGETTEKLLQKAEQTMTLAKTRSRNRYQFYIASVDSEMRRRRELERTCATPCSATSCTWSTSHRWTTATTAWSASRRCCAGNTRCTASFRRTCSFRWRSRTAASSASASGCSTRPAGNCANGTTRASTTCAWRSTCPPCNSTTTPCRGWSATCCRSTACRRAAWSWKSPRPA